MSQELTITHTTRTFGRRLYTPVALWRDLGRAWESFPALRARSGIDRAFGERIMLAVTSVNRCRYCSYGHARLALRAGVAPGDIQALLEGDVGRCDAHEIPALLFAQHYAESGGAPDEEARQKVVAVYGDDGAASVLAHVRAITLGNLLGNTFDALLWRLRGGRVPGSSVGSELAVLTLALVVLPVLAMGIAVRVLVGRVQ